ncbi:MAG TPA: CBS domain-containing protein [Burkholderiaceae bacterium]|nr:CBS domain-containing protein [Burkholderiaceae bacterium]HYB51126.1 CBS domain-containing protein [Burkholderiaceae bacterium]
MRISEICRREVISCGRKTSATELARMMRDGHVGDVIVVEDRKGAPVPIGIVTDRDLVVHVIAAGVAPDTVTAADLMIEDIVTAAETEYVYDAIWHMRSKGVRRLPVVDARQALVGVLTMDDVMRYVAEELGELARITPHQVVLERSRLR